MKASKKGCERYQNIFIEKKAKSINILEERHRNLSEEEKNKEQKYGHERFLKMKFKGQLIIGKINFKCGKIETFHK